jgi:RNA polymerase sigma-70 factor (sigma-E family)
VITTEPTSGFTDYVAANQMSLLRFAIVLTGDLHLAEEIVADVLVTVFERWPAVSGAANRHAYVRRMIANRYVSWRRKWGRLRPSPSGAIFERAEADASTEHAERDDVRRRLRELPPRQRAAIVLHFYEGMSTAEIADALDCRPGTVRSHLSRGLATLRIQYVSERTEGEPDHA